MPGVRAVLTENRSNKLDAIRAQLTRNVKSFNKIIEDLSVDHVDDKAVAKKIIAEAKKMKAVIEKLAS